MDLLVVGGSGFLGREITRQAVVAGEHVVATFHSGVASNRGVDWRAVDIRRRDEVAALVTAVRPAVVINAASDSTDWSTTADGAEHVAVAAAAQGARLVHVSSDAVFSGLAVRYDETAVPDPTTPYGAAKAAAETAIAGVHPSAIIARTSLIIGDRFSRHVAHVHALASGTIKGALFTDEVRCPIHVTDLAAALLELARSTGSGMRHLAGSDALSRHELGILIARRDGLDVRCLPRGLRSESGPPGPLDVRLDCTSTQARLATSLRGARTFLCDSPP